MLPPLGVCLIALSIKLLKTRSSFAISATTGKSQIAGSTVS